MTQSTTGEFIFQATDDAFSVVHAIRKVKSLDAVGCRPVKLKLWNSDDAAELPSTTVDSPVQLRNNNCLTCTHVKHTAINSTTHFTPYAQREVHSIDHIRSTIIYLSNFTQKKLYTECHRSCKHSLKQATHSKMLQVNFYQLITYPS